MTSCINHDLAQSVFQHGDAVARTIAGHLHSFVIGHRMPNLLSKTGFPLDVSVLYEVVIEAFAKHLDREIRGGLPDLTYKAVNFPRLPKYFARPFVGEGVADCLRHVAREKSVDDAAEFDVSLAIQIATKAITANCIEQVTTMDPSLPPPSSQSYEEWLAGFSGPLPE